jgi:hypothetical protein
LRYSHGLPDGFGEGRRGKTAGAKRDFEIDLGLSAVSEGFVPSRDQRPPPLLDPRGIANSCFWPHHQLAADS